jgi:hypothetical protein
VFGNGGELLVKASGSTSSIKVVKGKRKEGLKTDASSDPEGVVRLPLREAA